MIYYFSGTGNSLHVARQLADALGEQLCPMTTIYNSPKTLFNSPMKEENSSPFKGKVGKGSSIGLVFPVYAWGIPNVVERVAPLLLPLVGETFVYAVMTCGDDVGYADKVLESALGRKLDAAFSVQMPNTYVCLPGFDVDSMNLCKEKLAKEAEQVKEIAACVLERKSVRLLTRGRFPWEKTYVLNPLFNRFLLTDKYFHVDASRCVSCGRCRKSCPVGNIIVDEVPQWLSHCSGCLACYHACPYHAINFANRTQTKGQYNLLRCLG